MVGITGTGIWLALPSVKGCTARDVWQMGFGLDFKMGGDFTFNALKNLNLKSAPKAFFLSITDMQTTSG